jgi:hypothetical protein
MQGEEQHRTLSAEASDVVLPLGKQSWPSCLGQEKGKIGGEFDRKWQRGETLYEKRGSAGLRILYRSGAIVVERFLLPDA